VTFCSLLLLVGREGPLLPLSGLAPVQYFEREHLCSITRPREVDHVGQLREIAVRLLKEKTHLFGSRRSFSRPLRYPTVRF
jgi:hypothetical protein